MTREEAKREILFAKREVMADSWIDKAYDVAIKALEQPEQRWIPVTERLPDKSNFYICTKKNRLVKTVWYSALDGAWEEDVLAWMPLPEPYKGE